MNLYQKNLGLPSCGAAGCDKPVTHADIAGCGFCDNHAGKHEAQPLGGAFALDAWWCLASLARVSGGDVALAWSGLDHNEFPLPDDVSGAR